MNTIEVLFCCNGCTNVFLIIEYGIEISEKQILEGIY